MRLFISYRRKDTEGYVGALAVALQQSEQIPPVELFVDADKIPTGTDFVREMLAAVTSCDAVLACVGPQWRGAEHASSSARILRDDDPVRAELRTALSTRVPVFVALFDGAKLPSRSELPDDLVALTNAPATPISDRRFEQDLIALVSRIRAVVDLPERAAVAQAKVGLTAPPGKYWSSVEIVIDGKSAGRFKPKADRVTEFIVAPGRHTVRAKSDVWKSNSVTVQAKAGATALIRFTPGRVAWQMRLEVTD